MYCSSGGAEERAYQDLKAALSAATALTIPNFSLPLRIETDASKMAVGYAIWQKDACTGILQPICYGSKKLTEHESRILSSCELELLALLCCIRDNKSII